MGLPAFLPKPEHIFVVLVNSFIEIILKIIFGKIHIVYIVDHTAVFTIFAESLDHHHYLILEPNQTIPNKNPSAVTLILHSS